MLTNANRLTIASNPNSGGQTFSSTCYLSVLSPTSLQINAATHNPKAIKKLNPAC